MSKQLRFINTRLEIDIESGDILHREGFWYCGPVEECKGASEDQTQLAATQKQFATQLASDYSKSFADQTGIVGSLKSSLAPIINAGAGQYGFSNAEDAAMRTQASAGTSNAYRSAKQATGEAQAAQGGGDTFLPSGVKTVQQQQIAEQAAQQDSAQQAAITQAGYATGRAQFNGAVGQETGLAGILNPSGLAGQVSSANTSAMNDANEVANLNNAANPWGTIGGILGGAAGAFLGPMGASIGSKLGSKIGGAAGGTSGAGAGSLPFAGTTDPNFDGGDPD